MSQALIRQAFEGSLATWAAAQTPPIPVAWENVSFTPPAGRYARASLLPGGTASDDLEGLLRSYLGLFQVSLCMPIGSGSAEAEALVASLDAQFSTTAPMTSGALTVYITAPMSAAAALAEPDRHVIPVACAYTAHTISL